MKKAQAQIRLDSYVVEKGEGLCEYDKE